MPATHVQFTPAASATFQGASTPTPITLPPVDAANPAVVLHNPGPGEVHVVTGAMNMGGAVLNAVGAVRLHEGQVVLLPPGSSFAAATAATIQGGRLIFTRGALSPVWMFPAPGVAVI